MSRTRRGGGAGSRMPTLLHAKEFTVLQTYEAVLQPNGTLQFFDLPGNVVNIPRRVLVTFTDETALSDTALCGANLSESVLAQDWLREEEDAAWAHLQPNK